MSDPKLHHYVPRFHLARFAGEDGRVWTFDKQTGNVFPANSNSIAAERGFYKLPEFSGTGVDPLFLEKKFSQIEGEACNIIACWLRQLSQAAIVEIPEVNRRIMSDFLALQFFRTADARELLKIFLEANGSYPQGVDPNEARSLHAMLLCQLADGRGLIAEFSKRIHDSIWLFARNDSSTPFITSDTPVQLKSGNNRVWLKGPGMFAPGVYVVFPITPSTILYCKEPTYWKKLERFANQLSPVSFTTEMVDHENSGQVGLSRRFIFSPENNFDTTKSFLADMVSKPGPLSPEHIKSTINDLYNSPPI